MPLAVIYPTLDAFGQCLYLLCIIAMTVRGWWRKFPLFYLIQIAQFGELLWLLYLARTNPNRFYWGYVESFWPNLLCELLALITCFVSWNRRTLWRIGIAYAVHAEARYLHFLTTGSDTMQSLGFEFLVMKSANLAICFVIFYVLYFAGGSSPQESTNERPARAEETSNPTVATT